MAILKCAALNGRKIFVLTSLAKIVNRDTISRMPRGFGTRIARIVGAVVVFVACPVALEAQPLPAQQAALAGLTSLRVEAQLVGATANIWFTESSISEAVEQRLRRGSLEVRGRDDRSARGDPRLRVAVQAVNAAGGYAFLVSVQLVERVVNYRRYGELVLDGALPTAPTDSVGLLDIAPGIKWEAQALGTTSRENAINSVPNALLTYVDRFLEDYQVVNRR